MLERTNPAKGTPQPQPRDTRAEFYNGEELRGVSARADDAGENTLVPFSRYVTRKGEAGTLTTTHEKKLARKAGAVTHVRLKHLHDLPHPRLG
jgi:hypothetical protein